MHQEGMELNGKKITPQQLGSLSVLDRSDFKMDLCWYILFNDHPFPSCYYKTSTCAILLRAENQYLHRIRC
jgi:hypothetical protein